jgi:hypothetical protein
MSTALLQKVQLTRDEFIRQLPDALGDMTYEDFGDRVVVSGGSGKKILISIKDLGIEEKGSLELPMQLLSFDFQGMLDDEIGSFMKHWEEHKLRMGG